jgi:crotonobetainyl-CoA:carnitine CoA-transferase CaiB-like acyl-CoA transferase
LHELLSGVRVLDLTRLLPGPYATLLLADLGAEVIKIEEPRRGDPVRALPPFLGDESARFLALNRNKKSLTLDLKSEKGRTILLKLAETSDVVIEGFRPGVARRLGIDYERVRKINSEIVYCSLSGYGQSGPYREHVGHDINYIARAGLLSLTGPERPIIPGVPVADLAGAMFAAFSIVAALWARDRGQGGVYLDVSLTEAVVSWLSVHLAESLVTGRPSDPGDLVLTGAYPCYAIYETKDERYLTVGALEGKFWAKLCEAIGVPEFIPYQFASDKREEIFEKLREIFRSKTLAEWLGALDPKEIPVAPVLDLHEVATDPHLQRRGLLQPPGIAFPVRISEPSRERDRPAPRLGEHTRKILSQLGLSAAEIDRLAQEGVI